MREIQWEGSDNHKKELRLSTWPTSMYEGYRRTGRLSNTQKLCNAVEMKGLEPPVLAERCGIHWQMLFGEEREPWTEYYMVKMANGLVLKWCFSTPLHTLYPEGVRNRSTHFPTGRRACSVPNKVLCGCTHVSVEKLPEKVLTSLHLVSPFNTNLYSNLQLMRRQIA